MQLRDYTIDKLKKLGFKKLLNIFMSIIECCTFNIKYFHMSTKTTNTKTYRLPNKNIGYVKLYKKVPYTPHDH